MTDVRMGPSHARFRIDQVRRWTYFQKVEKKLPVGIPAPRKRDSSRERPIGITPLFGSGAGVGSLSVSVKPVGDRLCPRKPNSFYSC